MASFGAQPFLTSATARHDSSGYCAAGDVIAYEIGSPVVWAAGRITFFFTSGTVSVAVVAPLTQVKRETAFSVWQSSNDHCVAVKLEDVVEALTFRASGNLTTVLHPYALQHGWSRALALSLIYKAYYKHKYKQIET